MIIVGFTKKRHRPIFKQDKAAAHRSDPHRPAVPIGRVVARFLRISSARLKIKNRRLPGVWVFSRFQTSITADCAVQVTAGDSR